MKSMGKRLAALVLMLCVLMLPLTASADTGINLMPQDESGYTIVEGDGTVALEDGKMIITNNTDGDLRIWINYATPFDMTVHNSVVMDMTMDMPFKMAFHLISDADGSDDWLTTSTDYLDVFELDTATDRSPAGAYGVEMNIGDLAKDITDKSSVHFDQFIILMTGKGTFQVNAVELFYVPFVDDIPDEIETEDDTTEDTEEPAASDTLTIGAIDEPEEDRAFPIVPVVVGAVVLVAATVVVIVLVKNRKG